MNEIITKRTIHRANQKIIHFVIDLTKKHNKQENRTSLNDSNN